MEMGTNEPTTQIYKIYTKHWRKMQNMPSAKVHVTSEIETCYACLTNNDVPDMSMAQSLSGVGTMNSGSQLFKHLREKEPTRHRQQ